MKLSPKDRSFTVRDKRTNRRNKLTKIIEATLEIIKHNEFVFYIPSEDQIFIGTSEDAVNYMLYKGIVYGMVDAYELLGEL